MVRRSGIAMSRASSRLGRASTPAPPGAAASSFLPRQPVHSLLTGRHASRLRGRGLEFEELRHYFEGDRPRAPLDYGGNNCAPWRAAGPRPLRGARSQPAAAGRPAPVHRFSRQRAHPVGGRCGKRPPCRPSACTPLSDRVGAIMFPSTASTRSLRKHATPVCGASWPRPYRGFNRLLGADPGRPARACAVERGAASGYARWPATTGW